MPEHWKHANYRILLLRLGEAVTADLVASLLMHLGWKDALIHLGIVCAVTLRGFFTDWRRALGDRATISTSKLPR